MEEGGGRWVVVKRRLTSSDAVMGSLMIHQMKATSVSSQHLGQTPAQAPVTGERAPPTSEHQRFSERPSVASWRPAHPLLS